MRHRRWNFIRRRDFEFFRDLDRDGFEPGWAPLFYFDLGSSYIKKPESRLKANTNKLKSHKKRDSLLSCNKCNVKIYYTSIKVLFLSYFIQVTYIIYNILSTFQACFMRVKFIHRNLDVSKFHRIR